MNPFMIDTAQLASFLAVAERRHAEPGWGVSPPVLGMICAAELNDHEVAFGIEMFPVQPADLDFASPDLALAWIGGQMRYESPPKLSLNRDGMLFIGLVFVCEAVATHLHTGEKIDMRIVSAVDVAGGFYELTNDRSKRKSVSMYPPRVDHFRYESRPKGTIAIGLRDVLLGMAQNTDVDYIAVDKVAAIGAEPLERPESRR